MPRAQSKKLLPEHKSKQRAFCCNDEQYHQIKILANSAGTSFSAYLVQIALGTPPPRAVRQTPLANKTILAIVAEMGKTMQTLRDMPQDQHVKECRDAMLSVAKLLRRALSRKA